MARGFHSFSRLCLALVMTLVCAAASTTAQPPVPQPVQPRPTTTTPAIPRVPVMPACAPAMATLSLSLSYLLGNSSAQPTECCSQDREAKKEAFRKYLESSGVLDTLTKVLVALYEENDKPSSAVEFVQQKLGGPSISDYEKLKAEKLDLQLKYDKLLDTHKETCRQLEELKNMKYGAPWN